VLIVLVVVKLIHAALNWTLARGHKFPECVVTF
jgi:hypothetical protein